MNKRLLYFVLSGFAVGSMMVTQVARVRADTIVPETLIVTDVTWDKSGSPYILEGDVSVEGSTFTVKEGVEIISTAVEDEGFGIFVNGGKLMMNGKGLGDDRILTRDLRRIDVTDGSAYIQNVDMKGGGGFSFTNTKADISTSTITNAFQAITTKDSELSISGSRIEGNRSGIRVQPHEVFQVVRPTTPFTGGIGNALEIEPRVTITQSAITANTRTAIENYAEYTVLSSQNWWGSPDGPQRVGVNRVVGEAEYAPWLTEEPIMQTAVEIQCCSSILFLPGLQGSRLYVDEPKSDGSSGTSANTLWEPNRNLDIRKLYLDATGTSTVASVYTKDIVDKAYGLFGIYNTFLDFLEGLKKEKTIDEWNVFGYDWRMPIVEVVAGRQKRATTTESLVEKVVDMASRSRTGKVTLIAHSNGGLVTKYLVKTLEEIGKSDLIDTVISVAVPYLGTPEAIPALLHGDNQSLVQKTKGLIFSQSVMRGLGKNMASAYSLLPSREYFSKIFTPTIAFASSTMPGINNGMYPREITGFESFFSFIADTFGVRTAPSDGDVAHPIKGNLTLLMAADALHAVLDPYSWPSTIARWAVVGWNADTTKDLSYDTKHLCTKILFATACADVLTHQASTTRMGDGTVVAPSAGYNSGRVVSLDLPRVSQNENGSFHHADILQATTTQNIIKDMIIAGSISNTFALPSGASWDEPDYTKEPTRLVVSTHSPVELHVYDAQGRHTGRVAPPADIEEGLVVAFDEAIPDSQFRFYGNEDDPDTYVYLPDNTGQTYSIIMTGTDVGSATLEIERVRGGETVDRVVYPDFTVMPMTVASTTVTSNITDAPGSFAPRLASTTPSVKIDIDGNGSVDATARQGIVTDINATIELVRTTVRTLLGPIKRADNIDKRLVRLVELIKKGKLPKAKMVATKLTKKVGHINSKKITTAEKEQVIAIIEAMIGEVE